MAASMGRWADAAGHPAGATLVADGYIGVLVYAGTPGRAKNITRAVYNDYVTHGLKVAAVYEDGVNDIASGAGAAHAQAIMADLLNNVGAPNTTPIAAAADEHLTAAQVVTGTGYQRDFYNTAKGAHWAGPVGGYGFSEYTRAISAAKVADWLWQAGSASSLWAGVTFWQRNDGYASIGGVQADINEQYLPVGGTSMATLDSDDLKSIYQSVWFGGSGYTLIANRYSGNGEWPETLVGSIQDRIVRLAMAPLQTKIDALATQMSALAGAVAAIATNPAVTADQVAVAIDAAVEKHLQVTVNVTPTVTS